MKCLKYDSDGEYSTNEFQPWFKEKFITHLIATAYSPESNGNAERLNRTLLTMMTTVMMMNLNANK